jgi:hypothetical protein
VDGLSLRELLDSLEAQLLLDAHEIEVGETVRAEVELRNVGSATLEFQSGRPLTASLLDPLTLAPVGGFRGWMAGVGIEMSLAPNATARLLVLLGTHYDGRRALPPGIYLAQVRVPIHTMSPDESRYDTIYIVASLVEVRIVPKAPYEARGRADTTQWRRPRDEVMVTEGPQCRRSLDSVDDDIR